MLGVSTPAEAIAGLLVGIAARFLSRRLGLDLFASAPVVEP
jgi:hypothetical protein